MEVQGTCQLFTTKPTSETGRQN